MAPIEYTSAAGTLAAPACGDRTLSTRALHALQGAFLLALAVYEGCAVALTVKWLLFSPVSVRRLLAYALAGALPCLLVLGLAAGLLLRRRWTRALIARIDPWALRERRGFWPAALLLWVIGIGFFPQPAVALLHMIGGAALLVILWSMYRRDVRPVLAAWFPLGLLALPLLLELCPSRGAIWWGTNGTHRYAFRTAPPVVGPGGRLAPDMDVLTVGLDTPFPRQLKTNSWGFRNSAEFPRQKPTGELRVLSLGDSYSTGYHLGQDRFLGPLLERRLGAALGGRPVRVLSAEVSDPAYGLYYLQHEGMAFEPDVVLYGLCANDLVQAHAFAGPGERFVLGADGVLALNPEYDHSRFVDPVLRFQSYVYPSLPGATFGEREGGRGRVLRIGLNPWRGYLGLRAVRFVRELLFRPPPSSNFCLGPGEAEAGDRRKRLIDGFPNIGFFAREEAEPITAMYRTGFVLFSQMQRTCQAEGIDLVVLYWPAPFEVVDEEWDRLCEDWGLRPEDFDLERQSARLDEFCGSQGIRFVDVTGLLAGCPRPARLFLPCDAHPSEPAHELVAERMAEVVRPLLDPPAAASGIRTAGTDASGRGGASR